MVSDKRFCFAATLLADVKAKYGDELEAMRRNIDTSTGSGVR